MSIIMKDDQKGPTESIEDKHIRLIDKYAGLTDRYSAVVDRYTDLVLTHLELRDHAELLADDLRELRSETKYQGDDGKKRSSISVRWPPIGTVVNGVEPKKRWVVQSCETIGHTDRLRFEAHEAKVGKTDNVVLADGFEMHLNSKVFSIRECE